MLPWDRMPCMVGESLFESAGLFRMVGSEFLSSSYSPSIVRFRMSRLSPPCQVEEGELPRVAWYGRAPR